jgi:hypothetical protein
MRKILFTVLVGSALLAGAPATALARGDAGHGRAGRGEHQRLQRHHRADRAHARRHARVRDERFGGPSSSSTGSSSSSTTGGSMTGGSQNAGTVQSFQNGILTIVLADNSTVSGQVNGATRIECRMAGNDAGQPEQARDEGQGNNDQADGADQQGGEDQGDGAQQQGDDDGGQGDENQAGQMCSTTSLTPGAVVHQAELSVSSAGSVWKDVELAS